MANCYGTVLMKQKHRLRLAYDIASSDNNALLTGNIYSAFLYKFHNTGGCTRYKVIIADHNLTYIYRVERINILFRVNSVNNCLFINVLGYGELNKYTRNAFFAVKFINQL